MKKKYIIVIVIFLVFILIILGVKIIKNGINNDNYINDANFIQSTTLYDSFPESSCDEVDYIEIKKHKNISKKKNNGNIYQNKDILNGKKPIFSDIKYKFKDIENYNNEDDSGDYIVFDLGGGFSYYNYDGDEADIVDKYSCYNKYEYNNKTKEITLYPDKYALCDDMIDMNKSATIKFKSFKTKGNYAYLTIDFNKYTKTFKSKIYSYNTVNRDVTGKYILKYKCDSKKITEEIILNQNNTGIVKINNKKYDINYFIIKDIFDDESQEDILFLYSKNNAIFLELEISDYYLSNENIGDFIKIS